MVGEGRILAPLLLLEMFTKTKVEAGPLTIISFTRAAAFGEEANILN